MEDLILRRNKNYRLITIGAVKKIEKSNWPWSRVKQTNAVGCFCFGIFNGIRVKFRCDPAHLRDFASFSLIITYELGFRN